ncbi:PQQ-like beta-propeller repeat protein [Citreimonas salinaria]|uniref:Outer membrane protein assembly factor BamB, contains PQQ-like beta-propeller repeat n=1 Tax=Citreimonas salinaria TaxID=321339 RepID=A0A1H3G3P5_9RHOB|nr:PQQ-like beta-propeller repeat protein [Citreimonas salinaria]SDX97054.1 Outer membrane protein assembly factor BamB, contains PQQ-like beta-propeller repeat [Citreimonas salinaria]
MARTAILGTLGMFALLAACTEREPILPGDRLDVRALSAEGDPAAQPAPLGPRPIALPAPVANAAWAQSPVTPAFRPAHPALDGTLSLAWSVDIGAGDSRRKRLGADPVVAGGRIFTMDADHTVRATSTAGVPLWQATLIPPRDGPRQGQGGGLAFADGTLYASTGFGTLTALDAATGARRWQQDLDNTATGAPSVADGLVYVTSGDRTGWAVETGTGRVRWQMDEVGDVNNVAGAPAPALGDDVVVFAFGDGGLRAAFRQGGLRRWSADLLGRRNGVARATVDDVTGDPLIAGDTVYAGNHSGRLVAFNLFDGERLWTLREGALGPVWPAGDSVFFVSDRNELIRADASTGAILWQRELPGYKVVRDPSRRRESAYVNHGPVLAGGRLMVAGSDGVLRAFDPVSGALVGRTAIPDGATTRPVVAGGTLYVVNRRGQLLAYR